MGLTLSGLVLSVVVLMIGLIFSETYLSSKLSQINLYNQYNAIVVEGGINYQFYTDVSMLDNVSTQIELIDKHMYRVSTIKQGNRDIYVMIKGIRTNNTESMFLCQGDGTTLRYEAELLYGRLLNEEDIENQAKVTVIDEYLAEILFGKKDAVDSTITFPVYKINDREGVMEIDYYEELKVVGIISGSNSANNSLKNALKDNSKADEIQSLIYTPLSVGIADKKIDDYIPRITVFTEEKDRTSIFEEIEYLCSQEVKDFYNIYSFDTLRYEINSEIESIQHMIIYIVIFMFVISGICIINTMLFSVKERINEIGIRKAIGAFKHNIINQFVFEGFIYGVISWIIGIIISIFASSCFYVIADGYNIWNVYLIISKEAVLLTFLSSVLIGTMASVLPAVYASNISITDAIKYD